MDARRVCRTPHRAIWSKEQELHVMKHWTIAPLAFAVAVTGSLAFASAASAQSTYVNIGTAGIGGGYYPTGGYICNLVNKTRESYGHNIRCTVESTAGSVANLRSIAAGETEVAIVQADWQKHAYDGTSVFKEIGPQKELRYVMGLHSDVIHIVASKKSGIKGWDDLKGKTVNTGNVGSGTEATIYTAMDAYGLKPAEFFGQETKLTSREQASALCDGKIDAFIYPTGVTAASITEATNTCDVTIANWWDSTIEGLLEKYSYYVPITIPAGVYRGVDSEAKSWGMPATLVSTTRMSEDAIYNMVKAVLENFEDFKKQSTLYLALQREDLATGGRSVPMHPGAEKAYKEAGLLK
jgi:TRAP transporter TAXI family solute receptor